MIHSPPISVRHTYPSNEESNEGKKGKREEKEKARRREMPGEVNPRSKGRDTSPQRHRFNTCRQHSKLPTPTELVVRNIGIAALAQ